MKKSKGRSEAAALLARLEETRREEEQWRRPRIEICPDPYYDEWAEWVRSHERKKMGNPVDLCEIMPAFRASPLCPIGHH